MLTYPNCKITSEDDVIPAINGALVQIHGESPNAYVRISLPKGERPTGHVGRGYRKWQTAERFSGSTVSRSEKRGRKGEPVTTVLTVSGVSEDYLRRGVGLSKAEATATLTILVGAGGCENCG